MRLGAHFCGSKENKLTAVTEGFTILLRKTEGETESNTESEKRDGTERVLLILMKVLKALLIP